MEGGGVGLSYTNGIGSPQQLPAASEAMSSSSTSRATRTESGSVSSSARNGSTNAVPVDEANVSSAANLVARALSGSDVRTDHVAALQQSIGAGTYNISSSDVATKVISALLN